MYALRIVLAALWMHGAAFLGFMIYCLSFGRSLEWTRRHFLPFASDIFLAIFGIRVEVHGPWPKLKGPVIWICNHRSALDIFVILSLGLPRTRYFLSDFLQKIPAFFVIGRILKTYWTPGQSFPERRTALFQRAAENLQQSGDSVFLTPEGERIDSRFVGKFNKGAFHLAMEMQREVVPIYVDTPDETSPGRSWRLRRGIVRVSFMEPVSAPAYRSETLPAFVQSIRSMFLVWASQSSKGD